MKDKISVVIVDDDCTFAASLGEFLRQQEDFELAGILSKSSETCDLIAQKKPDVVLLNISASDPIEPDIFNMLNGMCLKQGLDFIIMGELGIESVMQASQRLGIVYFLIKPFDFDNAAQRIRLLCGCAIENAASARPRPYRPPMSGNSLESKISRVLYSMGITPNILGYQYLKDSVMIALSSINTEPRAAAIYTAVASRRNTTPSRVERAIQYAKILHMKRKQKEINSNSNIAQMKYIMCPTNLQFIKNIVERILYRAN